MPETDGPLLTLARRLHSLGPPSLSILVARLADAEEYNDFVALVREFLAEREQDILGRPGPVLQIEAFADYFEDRYFPLDDRFKMGDVEEGYSELLRGIPVIPLGSSYDDYHEMTDSRLGLRLMTYLLADPYGEGEGARVALAEACADRVPTDLLSRVPEGGISRGEAHHLLKGTTYEALATWADMLETDTGNYFLDTSGEWLWEAGLPPWSQAAVEDLTRQWHQAEGLNGKVFELAEWLEEDPPANFEELLAFLDPESIRSRKEKELSFKLPGFEDLVSVGVTEEEIDGASN